MTVRIIYYELFTKHKVEFKYFKYNNLCRPIWLVCTSTLRFKLRFRIIKHFKINFSFNSSIIVMLIIILTIYRRDSNNVLETKYENQLNKVTWEDTEI